MASSNAGSAVPASAALRPLRERLKRLGADELDLLFRQARSMSRFSERPVPDALLRELIALTLMGPTSMNSQPARFVFVQSEQGKERLLRAVSAGNVPKVASAPVSVIIGHDLRFFEHLGQLYPHRNVAAEFESDAAHARETAFRNGSLQGAYLILAARALGLDAGPISGFDNVQVDSLFFQGTSIRSNFLCNLGYGDDTVLRARHPRPAFDAVCRLA